MASLPAKLRRRYIGVRFAKQIQIATARCAHVVGVVLLRPGGGGGGFIDSHPWLSDVIREGASEVAFPPLLLDRRCTLTMIRSSAAEW